MMREQQFYEVTEQRWKKEGVKGRGCKLEDEQAWSGEWRREMAKCTHLPGEGGRRAGGASEPCVIVHPKGAACQGKVTGNVCEGHKSCA